MNVISGLQLFLMGLGLASLLMVVVWGIAARIGNAGLWGLPRSPCSTGYSVMVIRSGRI